jgi:HK97 family phage prohead protease
MTIRTETRDVGPLAMRAAVTSIDEKRRTVEVMFSSGARVHRPSWYGSGTYEELSMDAGAVRMDRLKNGAPMLAQHQRGVDNVIGVVESARLENGKGYATVRFAKAEDDPRADQIFRKVVDKVITGVSIGYRVFKSEKVEDGSTTIPVFRATDWEPYEISRSMSPPSSAPVSEVSKCSSTRASS